MSVDLVAGGTDPDISDLDLWVRRSVPDSCLRDSPNRSITGATEEPTADRVAEVTGVGIAEATVVVVIAAATAVVVSEAVANC